MKIERLSLGPFAGFAEKELRFLPGLNVVLGPNDVGKSSVFRAVESALFLRTKVSRSTKEGKVELPRLIPVRGDHARLTLEFSAKGAQHKLEKVWGQGASTSLETAGARLAQEERVEETLRALLPAPPATFQSVLLMRQGALEGTVATLEKERDALHSLGDLLRVSVDQTAGVSVERLRARLGDRIEAAFSHWDQRMNLPEKGKGIEDPWNRNLGTVLEVYYERETLRKALREASELEAERDRKLAALNERQAALDLARAFVRENEGLATAVSERQGLEARFQAAAFEVAALEKDQFAWLRAEAEVSQARPDVERLEPLRKKLDEELNAALERSRRQVQRERLERARAARNAVTEAREKLAALPPLKADDLKRLRAAIFEIERLKGQLKGGKLQLQLHVKRELEVSFRKDFEAERKGLMAAGKSMTLNAGARIQLANEWFELQVTGGDGGFGEAEERLRGAEDLRGRLLEELKVKSLEEAEDRQAKNLPAQAELKAAEDVLARALPPGEKIEDLERALSADTGSGGRDAETIRAELRFLQGELEAKRKSLDGAESVVRSLRDRSGVADAAALGARVLDRKAALAALRSQRDALPGLPGHLGNAEEFLARYRRARDQLPNLSDELGQLRAEVAEVKGKLTEQSAQDLERAYRAAADCFDRELARARALLRVDAVVGELETEGGDRYGGFRADLEKLVLELSDGKYRKARLSDALPTEFERRDGAPIPFEWLSGGTKDAFALALRLAMAGHFLGAADGFLLIDDPLVNMDPARQKTAAAMLRDFARERQVVLFTCHPAHAELLGGNRIEL